MLLRSGVARVARERGASYLIDCASVSTADHGANAAAVYIPLARQHLAPPRISGRSSLAVGGARDPDNVDLCHTTADQGPPSPRIRMNNPPRGHAYAH
jgi:hypothetical protein